MTRNVQEICRQQGISLLELADRTQLDLKRVQSIYLARWTPSAEERTKIAEALGMPVEEVAFGHQTPIQHIYGSGPG